jgi:hypothetical protein
MKIIVALILLLFTFASLSQTDVREVNSEDIYTSKNRNLVLSELTIDTAVRYCLFFLDEQYQDVYKYKYLMFDDTIQVVNFMNRAISSIKTLKEYQLLIGEEYVHLSEHFYQGLTVYAKGGWFSLTYKNAEALLAELRRYNQPSNSSK